MAQGEFLHLQPYRASHYEARSGGAGHLLLCVQLEQLLHPRTGAGYGRQKKTLPILIAQLRSADFLKFDMGKVYMLVAIAILPVIIVYLLLSKFIVRGVALGGVKG